ncbi:uncharacterized protein BCR38DRAFT_32372 [Pseudomassariella vexata]|uniref:Uncharacterized protein n=1 Tax=Pseudomassariella vexata TaxID=1141098 RepID=A0A1Y2DQC1_9PEZI|nr:uncharacterized protein BCR38DRAFT_32372 [Pseudomassariella vexata]ORY61334.1 hypothetical protein BCR38DRAFT_32372 [Pseudomassariella vexata]
MICPAWLLAPFRFISELVVLSCVTWSLRRGNLFELRALASSSWWRWCFTKNPIRDRDSDKCGSRWRRHVVCLSRSHSHT